MLLLKNILFAVWKKSEREALKLAQYVALCTCGPGPALPEPPANKPALTGGNVGFGVSSRRRQPGAVLDSEVPGASVKLSEVSRHTRSLARYRFQGWQSVDCQELRGCAAARRLKYWSVI